MRVEENALRLLEACEQPSTPNATSRWGNALAPRHRARTLSEVFDSKELATQRTADELLAAAGSSGKAAEAAGLSVRSQAERLAGNAQVRE